MLIKVPIPYGLDRDVRYPPATQHLYEIALKILGSTSLSRHSENDRKPGSSDNRGFRKCTPGTAGGGVFTLLCSVGLRGKICDNRKKASAMLAWKYRDTVAINVGPAVRRDVDTH